MGSSERVSEALAREGRRHAGGGGGCGGSWRGGTAAAVGSEERREGRQQGARLPHFGEALRVEGRGVERLVEV